MKTQTALQTLEKVRSTERVELADGNRTTIHAVRYERMAYQPRIVVFDEAMTLLDWCQSNDQEEAIVGGFFTRDPAGLLGDTWLNGVQQPAVRFMEPYHATRGSLHITLDGEVAIDRRYKFSEEPSGSLLQAGPLLVRDGISLVTDGYDQEGFSAGRAQFDSDITDGRYPRAAIAVSAKHIWSIVCDGRSPQDAGMTLPELADYAIELGADQALNLDGGGSASVVTDGKLINKPRTPGATLLRGRPIYSAVVFGK
jgi:hypothetical protein